HIRTLLMTFFYRQMPRLVAEGHLYVAQPPLYLIAHRNDRRYVQTEAEMHAILMGNGLRDASLRRVGPGSEDGAPAVDGEKLRALVEIAAGLDNALRAFGRRNLPIGEFLKRAHPDSGLMPLFLVRQDEADDVYLYSAEELERFTREHAPESSDAAPVADADVPEAAPPAGGDGAVADADADADASAPEAAFRVSELGE